MVEATTKVSIRFFYGFVGVTGAAVMMLEFAASRVMAPWFGTSTLVWGNIVGVVLIALSFGYYYGGRLADRRPQSEGLAVIVMGAGIFTGVLPFAIQAFSQAFPVLFVFSGWGFISTIIGSFFSIVCLFALPIFLLGMVSPYTIRLATDRLQDAGKISGGLYAWSTLGSIIGTFASAFWLVPYIGSRETITLASLLLIAVAALLFGKRRWTYVFLLVPIIVYSLIGDTPIRAASAIIHEEESAYNYLKVVDAGDRLKLVVNEGLGVQSYYMKNGVLTGAYYDYAALTPYLQNYPTDAAVLILGLAGGSLSRQLDYYFPEYTLTGVEIDPAIVNIANTYFGLGEQDVTVVVDDARRFVQVTDQSYDIIMIDAFANEMYIPWHLTTRDFFSLLKEHLNPSGMVTFNVGSTAVDSNLMQALVTTLQSEFSVVAIVPVHTSLNYVVIASQQPLQPAALSAVTDERATIAEYFQAGYYEPALVNGFLLTDNRAPVELFTEQMVLEYIKEML